MASKRWTTPHEADGYPVYMEPTTRQEGRHAMDCRRSFRSPCCLGMVEVDLEKVLPSYRAAKVDFALSTMRAALCEQSPPRR